MTLVSTMPAVETKSEAQGDNTNQTESLTIGVETMICHDPDGSQIDAKTKGNDLRELFEQTLNANDEKVLNNVKWVGENEIQVDGLSGMTLHNFLLKVEALGKKVTYRRSTVFTITD